MKPKSGEPEYTSVTFGSVTVNVKKPTAGELKRRLEGSHHFIQCLKNVVCKPGVKLSLKKTTPTYTADRWNPDLVIQKIGNKKTRGEFKHGRFVAVAA